jgi:hypothetical protein
MPVCPTADVHGQFLRKKKHGVMVRVVCYVYETLCLS